MQVTTDLKVGSMRVEVWVASSEPAVGVFTTAGTCQGRLRRHFVITAMALRATLECDLPRQDLGTYQEDGGGPEPLRCVP
jgi:hypothetical protein